MRYDRYGNPYPKQYPDRRPLGTQLWDATNAWFSRRYYEIKRSIAAPKKPKDPPG